MPSPFPHPHIYIFTLVIPLNPLHLGCGYITIHACREENCCNGIPTHTIYILAYLRFSTNTTTVPSEGYYLLLGHDIFEVAYSLPQVHVFDSLGSLTSVLKVYPKVNSTGLTC